MRAVKIEIYMLLTYTEVAFYIDGKLYSDKTFPCDIFEK